MLEIQNTQKELTLIKKMTVYPTFLRLSFLNLFMFFTKKNDNNFFIHFLHN